jgi:hypothetical protein
LERRAARAGKIGTTGLKGLQMRNGGSLPLTAHDTGNADGRLSPLLKTAAFYRENQIKETNLKEVSAAVACRLALGKRVLSESPFLVSSAR